MSIKDIPHIQVIALRKAAIQLEKELSELKASLPKVRADAVRGAIKCCHWNVWTPRTKNSVIFIDDLEKHAGKLEAGQ